MISVMQGSRRSLISGVLLLLTAAGTAGALQAWVSDLDLTAVLDTSPVEQAALEAGVPLVDDAEMREIVENGSHLLLDARSLQEYDRGHLPGAMALPFSDFENAFPAIAPMLNPDDPLVVYCSGPRCDDALLLAGRLTEAGFGNVSLYLEGWEGWRP
jgi:rhodanese-related sulfurtransferase